MGQNNLQELNVIMMAPMGVGKTSLLAAMHEEFDSTFANAGLNTWVDDTVTLYKIIDCKYVLQNIDNRLKQEVTRSDILEDPWSRDGFIFKIGSGGKPFMQIHFHDPSGEYYKPAATTAQKEYVKEQLRDCDAVVIAVDATALMEKKTGRVGSGEVGPWHQEVNNPDRVTLLLKDAYTHIAKPRLIVFVPIKCETYMRNSADANSLVDHIQLGYSNLFSFLREDAQYSKVAIVITPVQTIGNVIYSHREEVNKETKFRYHKSPLNAPYAPKDGDQPLRYILRFLLNVYRESKQLELEKAQKELERIAKEAAQNQKALSEAKKRLSEAENKLSDRNWWWTPIRSVMNFFDDVEAPYGTAEESVKQKDKALQDIEEKQNRVAYEVDKTEEEIRTFNEAVKKFAIHCKEDQGFRILQGRNRWLSASHI